MKQIVLRLQIAVSCLIVFFSSSLITLTAQNQVNGTTGTPLGGFGAGALKFNANNGSFAIMTQPPADAYDFELVKEAKLQLFTERQGKIETVDVLKAKQINGRPDDDAIWPLHKVNFGLINGIQIDMTGFSPFDNKNYDQMSLPYAFYEIKLTNKENTNVNTSFAFQWNGKEPFSAVAGKGIASRSLTIFAASTDKTAVISAGSSDNQSFFATGLGNKQMNTNQGKTAVKVALKANETKTIRFVVSWYDDTDPEMAYYFNLYKNSEGVANVGLAQFDNLKRNAESLVKKMRASNLPDWLKDQTLNTLVNISTNSMYKKDGRVAFAEGQWTCFGTMDQMWHARQIVAQMMPFFAWQELHYWARTQMKNGQIHHDFNKMDEQKEKRALLVAWDDTEHKDYRNIDKWVDLNCAMIVSTYETYQITGDQKQFDILWPYLKKAGQRIFDQVELYGNKEYPYTFDHSENSYDAGGDPNPFNASMSAVAYKIMVQLAQEKGEKDLAVKYQKAYDTVVQSFEKRYLNDENFKLTKHSESYYSGQWLAFHLKLGEIWSAKKTDFVIDKLNSYYHPYYRGLGNPKGTYEEWTPYILVHYGGLLLHTNRASQWNVMQKDAYVRQYNNRDFVFDHPLNILPQVNKDKWIATNFQSGKQYISMPGIWRNYYDIVGYFRDFRTKELWIKPILPEEANHQMTDAMFVSPNGYGSVSCKESGEQYQNKMITVKTDNPMAVSTLYLADYYGKNCTVTINGKKYPFERKGTGYAKELAVKWNGTIDSKGINIEITGDSGVAFPALPEKPVIPVKTATVKTEKWDAYKVMEAEAANMSAGTNVASSATAGSYVTSCNNFDYIYFSNVDFGSAGAVEFLVKVASVVKGKGTSIEIALDNVAGEAIGTCVIPNTKGEDIWVTATASITKITGVHDVILRFFGPTSDNLMNIDKISFREENGQKLEAFK